MMTHLHIEALSWVRETTTQLAEREADHTASYKGSSLGWERLEREADHTPPYSAEEQSSNVFIAWC
jgi:hypothetical protein